MLTFEEERHQYYIDGLPVPSVTELVSPLGQECGGGEEDALELAMDAAAERGVTMHAYLAHRLQGGEREGFELPEAYESYASAAELFLAEHTIDPMLIETALPGPGFAGTPDLVCEFDGVLAIVDYKFVSQVAKSRVGAQLGGYQALCGENGIFPQGLFAVQFLPEGTYRLYPVDLTQAGIAFNVCRSLYELRTKKHPRGRIE